jgi:hypothetical protein
MRKLSHLEIRNLEARISKRASTDRLAKQIGRIAYIKASNNAKAVEQETINTAFEGFAQGIENTKDMIPRNFSKVIKSLGIRSPEDILYLYNNMDKLVDTNNPLIREMKERVERERSFKSKMALIGEMVDNYDDRDPLGFYEWWSQGQADLEEVEKYIDKHNLAQFFFYAVVTGGLGLWSAAFGGKSIVALVSVAGAKVLGIVIAAYLAIKFLGWSATALTNFFYKHLLPFLMRAGVKLGDLTSLLWSGLKGIGRGIADTFNSGVSKLKSWFGFGDRRANMLLLPLY